MKTIITTNTHEIEFETMKEVRELYRLLDLVVKSWDKLDIKEDPDFQFIVSRSYGIK